MTRQFQSSQQIVLAARNNLNQGAWDHLMGGAESETTLRRNRLAFDALGFVPRVLTDFDSIDPSMCLLGHRMRIPVMLAPIGSLHLYTEEGGTAAAQAAADFGTIHVVSTSTEPDFEAVAKASKAPKFLQLEVVGDWSWAEEMVHRARRAGYTGLCLTVDAAGDGRHERTLVNPWSPVKLSASERRKDAGSVGKAIRLTWNAIDRFREMWEGNFLLKGIMCADDALLSVEHGADAVWISNHGGRQLDHALSTMDVLPEVTEAVKESAEVLLDGGIQRGGDVAKAVALGARAVAIGKLQGLGLAAAGRSGLVAVLEILESELISCLSHLGVHDTSQIDKSQVRVASPVALSHEMSTWLGIPDGRLC